MDNSLTSSELEELIRLFPTPVQGLALLAESGMPATVTSVLPTGDMGAFWEAVAERIGAGVMHAGRLRLLDAARAHYPANHAFAAPHGPAPQVTAGRDLFYVTGNGQITFGADPARHDPVETPAARKEVKVFFAGASPFDIALDRIRADREFRAIQQVARPGSLTIANRTAATIKDFADLLDERPDLLHLCCHSDGGVLLLEDPTGEPHAIPVDSLVRQMTVYRDHGGLALRGLVLSICDSADFAEQFRSLAETIIAWHGDLDDDCAIEFAAAFYRAVCRYARLGDAGRIAATEVAVANPHCRSLVDQLVVLTT